MAKELKHTKLILHRYVREDNKKDVFLEMTYDQWFEKIFSDGHTDAWCIMLADGVKAIDMGVVRKKSMQTAGNWPMASYAAGVSDSEVPEMRAIDEKAGVPTEYNEEADPVFTSRGHRKRYLKAHELHDRNGGYGD